jgi:hypothetical protein
MIDERRACFTATVDDIEDAGRQAGLVQRFGQSYRAQRRQL